MYEYEDNIRFLIFLPAARGPSSFLSRRAIRSHVERERKEVLSRCNENVHVRVWQCNIVFVHLKR